jgi:hypothetical protein
VQCSALPCLGNAKETKLLLDVGGRDVVAGDNYGRDPGQCNLTNALSVNAVERFFSVFLNNGRFFSSCSVGELVVGGCKRQ